MFVSLGLCGLAVGFAQLCLTWRYLPVVLVVVRHAAYFDVWTVYFLLWGGLYWLG